MKYTLIACLFFVSGSIVAQDVSLNLQKAPIVSVSTRAAQWNALNGAVKVSFANSNTRYSQEVVPQITKRQSETLTGWKGEKVHTQLVIYGAKDVKSVNIQVSDLRSTNGKILSKENIQAGSIGYVITDEFRDGCGHRKSVDFDSSWVADPINFSQQSFALNKNTVVPVWVSVSIPSNTPAGVYHGKLSVKADKNYQLKFAVNVLDKTLPPPSEWKFNLDFWQHPAAIARVHNTPLWSDEHFANIKKYYTLLASAGQKNITASIVNEPWGHQTYDDFPSLVKWTKKTDGSWRYDYTLFDKYVAFVMDCGINKRINCYSMVPWKIAFQYYDEALGKDTVFTDKIGTPEYNSFWKPMLEDFTAHLKQKGWFNITAIAMDERPMAAMQAVIKLLKEVDKDWKIALAGDYHPEIESDIYDYCVASRWEFPKDTLQLRQQQNKLSTWYTCCVEKYPNGFTFSPPAEHVWIGWYTAAKNMDGYLRWAYNSWTPDPVRDSRFVTWPAGDTYQVYPGPMTSIRFEKLIEGIQDFEKIELLKKQYVAEGKTAKLKELETALKKFEINRLQYESAEQMIIPVKQLINKL